MKILGVVLLLVGVLVLVYGGITYNRQRTIIDVGSFKATATEQKTIPFSPILGGVALVVGVALLVTNRKRT